MKEISSILRIISDTSVERKVYIFTLTICAIASSWTLYHESKDFNDLNAARNRKLGLGWHLLGIKQDIANFEWTFWFSDLRESILLSLVGHVATSWIFSNYLPWAKDTAIALFCVYCAQAAVGGALIILASSICVIFYAVTSVFKSVWICWAATISSILLLHFDGFYMEILPTVLEADPNYVAIAYSALGFTILRTASFCLEKIYDGSSSIQHNMSDLFHYNFYLPYFFFGPVLTFDKYREKNTMTPTSRNIINIVKESLKVATTIMIVDLILHFIYVSSIAIDLDYIRKAPGYIIGFILFCNVLLDWLKASVLYGVTRSVAVVVDGHEGAPNGPPCTATICTFADTYFDRGIQHWVSRYCYDRIGGSHTNLSRELSASAATFLLVAIWQGPSFQVVVWAVLNCLGLTFEFFISQMTPPEDKRNERVVCFFLGLNYWCILFFNVIGINGIDTAFIGLKSLLFGGSIFNLGIAIFLSYCYAVLIYMDPGDRMKKQQ